MRHELSVAGSTRIVDSDYQRMGRGRAAVETWTFTRADDPAAPTRPGVVAVLPTGCGQTTWHREAIAGVTAAMCWGMYDDAQSVTVVIARQPAWEPSIWVINAGVDAVRVHVFDPTEIQALFADGLVGLARDGDVVSVADLQGARPSPVEQGRGVSWTTSAPGSGTTRISNGFCT